MPTQEVSCPHYPPPGTTQPTWPCRACGSIIADARHPQNQALGFVAHAFVGRPEEHDKPRKPERRA